MELVEFDPREKSDTQPQPVPEPVVLPTEPYNPDWDTIEKGDNDPSPSFPGFPSESDGLEKR